MDSATVILRIDEHGAVRHVEMVHLQDINEWGTVRAIHRFLFTRSAVARWATTWKYRPFKRSGRPAATIVADEVSLLPPERHPSRHVPFPGFGPSFHISISQAGGYSYNLGTDVSIAADGTVEVRDERWGRRAMHVPPSSVRALADQVRAADFFSLDDEYQASVTDASTTLIVITAGGKTKSVVDYLGRHAGMPQAVSVLEDAIYSAAGVSPPSPSASSTECIND